MHRRFFLYGAAASTLLRGQSDQPAYRVVTPVSVDLGTDPTRFGDSLRPEISADGRFITYVSFATDLVLGGTSNASNVGETYLYDRLTGETTLISRTNGAIGNGDREDP